MDSPNPKRPRQEVSSPTLNPNSLPVAPSSKPSDLDLIFSTLLSYPDSSLLLPSPSSIDLVLEKALASASDDVSVQNGVMNHFLEVFSLLQESTKRCLRKRASIHNSSSWPLPPELTIKAFSKLDTYSLMQAMVCCTMFHKYAMDSLCYSHINLTTSPNNVNNGVVSTMINRASKELRFLELGHVEYPLETRPLLTVTCLVPLSHNQGFIGKCLRTLHLYNIIYMDAKFSISVLSACSSLTDLKIVGLYSPCQHLLKSLATNCRSIEHLFLQTNYFQGKDSSDLVEFLMMNIPNITSLTLIGFRLNDSTVQNLVDSSRKLQYMNLTGNKTFKGRFLRDSGRSFKEGPLKTLILRNCSCLEETEVVQFINSLSSGDFRFIRHIDVSNESGLVCDGSIRNYKPNLPLEKLKEKRPGVTFLAKFPLARSSERPRVFYDLKVDEDDLDDEEDDPLDDDDEGDDDEDDLNGDYNEGDDDDDDEDDLDRDDDEGDDDEDGDEDDKDDEDDLEGDEDDKDDLGEDEDEDGDD